MTLSPQHDICSTLSSNVRFLPHLKQSYLHKLIISIYNQIQHTLTRSTALYLCFRKNRSRNRNGNG